MRKMKYLPKTAQLVNDKGRTPVPKLIILQYAGNLTDLPEVSTEGYRQKLTEKRKDRNIQLMKKYHLEGKKTVTL